MITFQISNTRVEGNEITAFYVFSNGHISTNRFPFTTNFLDIMAWGAERATWLQQREARILELEHELRNANYNEEV